MAIATLATAGALVLPGPAAAHSYYVPAYNPSVVVVVPASDDLAYDVVSWSD
jgi:hypothetical protein